MNAAVTPSSYGTQDPSSRVKGIVIVVVLHVLIGYALVSGMARKGLELVKKPLEAVVIQEVIIPPPPPPKKVEPPKEILKEVPKVQAPPPPFVPPPDVAPPVISTAPAIVATPSPPPAPTVIAPPAPPAPPAPAAPAPAPVVAGPKRAAIGVVCPTQALPEMPRRAIQDGTEGVVKAQILIRNGVVQEVIILSGPRVFHTAVKNAIAQYKCVADGPEVLATQDFNFKLD
ncbi:MAG: energy transducer TonB [Rhodoferax sp.]|nr:energy transducer TonB [Rhodoferax sp.]